MGKVHRRHEVRSGLPSTGIPNLGGQSPPSSIRYPHNVKTNSHSSSASFPMALDDELLWKVFILMTKGMSKTVGLR